MQTTPIKILALLTAIFVVFGGFQPLTAQAKVVQTKKAVATKKTSTYKIAVSESDNTIPADIASRCLTAGMKSLHAGTVKTMEADIAKRGQGHSAAIETYREKIDIVWSAMEQPYCGFGSMGMTAVKHSYNKSVDRIRAAFLAATK